MSQAAADEKAQSTGLSPASSAEGEITLILPAGYPGPTVGGKWKFLEDGRILARFTRRELALVLQIYREVVQPVLAAEQEEGVVSSSEGESIHG